MAYGDYKGEFVADFPQGMLDIKEVAEAAKIQTDGLTIIGFEIHEVENQPKRPMNVPPKLIVYLLAVHESSWNDKYKNFGEYWNKEKVLKVQTIKTNINLFDFYSKYLKRFFGRMVWSDLKNHELSIEHKE